MAGDAFIDPPDLPDLEPAALPPAGEAVELAGVLVDPPDGAVVAGERIRIRQSELRRVTIAGPVSTLSVHDGVLRDCDLSNVAARGASVRRVECHGCRLVGLDVSEAGVQDLRVAGGTAALAAFSFAGLRRVLFDQVNLTEASFLEARLEAVTFVDCELAGADFRGARLRDCVIRGSSLDGIVGVESLGGVRMPWADLIGSTAALARALGISVEDVDP